MAPIWTKNGPFWTNMAQGIPGNSHEVKIGLMPIKYIQADHLVIIDSGQWTAFAILAMFFENKTPCETTVCLQNCSFLDFGMLNDIKKWMCGINLA